MVEKQNLLWTSHVSRSKDRANNDGSFVSHPLTETEKRKYDAGSTEKTIVIDRLWNKRPDGFAIKMPTDSKAGELVILEFKRMSCVTDQYVKRARNVAEAQYASIKSALQQTLGPQGWTVSQKV